MNEMVEVTIKIDPIKLVSLKGLNGATDEEYSKYIQGIITRAIEKDQMPSTELNCWVIAGAEVADCSISKFTSKMRPFELASIRCCAMYLARKYTKHSLQEIGNAFGGRDHGTVTYASKKIQNMLNTTSLDNALYSQWIAKIESAHEEIRNSLLSQEDPNQQALELEANSG